MAIDPSKHQAASDAIQAQRQARSSLSAAQTAAEQAKAEAEAAAAAAQQRAAEAAAAAEQARAAHEASRQRTAQALQDAYGAEMQDGGIYSLEATPSPVLVKVNGQVVMTRPVSLIPQEQAAAPQP